MNRLLWIGLLFLNTFLHGQSETVFVERGEREISYFYQSDNGSTSSNINTILESLQTSNQPPTQKPYFKLLFYQNLRLEYLSDSLYELSIDLDNIHFENFPDYYGFDLSKQALPAKVKLYIEFFVDGKLALEYKMEMPIVKDQLLKSIQFKFKDALKDYKVKINGFDFLFNDKTLANFSTSYRLVNGYVTSFVELDAIGIALNELEDTEVTIHNVNDYERKLIEQNQAFRAIEKRRFWKHLEYKDAELDNGYQIEETKALVKNYLAYHNDKFEEIKAKEYLLHFKYGLALYHKGKKGKALQQFKLGHQENPKDPEILYMLALYDFEEENWENTETKIRDILNQSPWEELELKTLELGYALKNQYLTLGYQLIGKVPKEEIIAWYRKGLYLCNDFPKMDCDQLEFKEAMEKLEEIKD